MGVGYLAKSTGKVVKVYQVVGKTGRYVRNKSGKLTKLPSGKRVYTRESEAKRAAAKKSATKKTRSKSPPKRKSSSARGGVRR